MAGRKPVAVVLYAAIASKEALQCGSVGNATHEKVIVQHNLVVSRWKNDGSNMDARSPRALYFSRTLVVVMPGWLWFDASSNCLVRANRMQ